MHEHWSVINYCGCGARFLSKSLKIRLPFDFVERIQSNWFFHWRKPMIWRVNACSNLNKLTKYWRLHTKKITIFFYLTSSNFKNFFVGNRASFPHISLQISVPKFALGKIYFFPSKKRIYIYIYIEIHPQKMMLLYQTPLITSNT